MRSVLWMGYGGALLVGYLLMMSQQSAYPPGWVATRDLHANQLLQAGDVAPEGARQYLARDIKRGNIVRAHDLMARADLDAQPGEVPVAVPITPAQAHDARFDTGQVVRLCKAGKALEPLTVRAVLCADHSRCVLLVALPAAKAGELTAAFDKPPAATLEPASISPVCK